MANAGIEATLKKITDTQLVIVRLMETHEREWNKRFETSQGRMERLERRTEELDRGAEHLLRAIEKLWNVVEAHERRLDSHERRLDGGEEYRKATQGRIQATEDAVRTMLASMDRLIKTIEDMAKGRKRENGRRK